MPRIVFISGVWNIALGAGLLVPALYEAIGMLIGPFWGWILCAFQAPTNSRLYLRRSEYVRGLSV
jgi:uncharacterized membrane protein